MAEFVELLRDGQEYIVALLTWAATGIIRWKFPRFWDELETERVRLVVVGVVAVALAILTGISQGLALTGVLRLAFAALSGAVVARRLTRSGSGAQHLRDTARSLGRDQSIRTKPPAPMR